MEDYKYNSEKNDPYFYAYHIVMEALKAEDISDGLSKSLYFAKIYLEASDVILYRLNDNREYVHSFNQSLMDANTQPITRAINKSKEFLELKKHVNLDVNMENLKNVYFISIPLDHTKYILAITNRDKRVEPNPEFLRLLDDSMHIVLEKYETMKSLEKSAKEDSLTGLDNRNVFEEYMEEKGSYRQGHYVFGLFDLFRLKHINDNYNHAAGDEYIRKAAEIISKHFPKYIYTEDENGKTTRRKTGSTIYRIGGDEFALISTTETLESAKLKAKLIQEEGKIIDLGFDTQVGINFGLVANETGENLKQLYLLADDELSKDKRQMYQELGLDRRK